jgi:nitroimidazol reductase NimA-like FMN-containing flavoprotein (pyridoxamine 5'-phosphate oxidase superfamily)
MGAKMMRRKEFNIETEQDIQEFLHDMSFGSLALQSEDGWPLVIPLNFVYHQGHIYFHGSKIGEKMRSIAADNRVSFSVAREFAQIPSYWSDPKFACPATVFFKSVFIRGRAVILTDLEEKAAALTAFMEKLQPEGGYEQIDPSDPGYAKHLGATGVVKIEVASITAKFKFGQNWSEKRSGSIVEELTARGSELDEETARLMKLYCPHHKSEN